MPDIKGNNQKIYDLLSSQGAQGIGENSDQFQKFMENDTNRRKVYDYLHSINAGGIGDSYEDFSAFVYAAPTGNNQQNAAPQQVKVADTGKNERPVQQAFAEQTSKWAVPQADWNPQEKPFYGPGEPVSAPKKKAQEPAPNPFPARGNLDREIAELREQKAAAGEAIKDDIALIEEYERRLNENKNSLDPGSKKVQDNNNWLYAHRDAYRAAKNSDAMKEYSRLEGEVSRTENAIASARNDIERRKNREEMESPTEVIATGKTALGNDNIGRRDKEYELRKMADELSASTAQEYNKSSKYDETSPVEQFFADAGNNIDSGSLTFGLSKGLAEKRAREVGDKYNGLIDGALKSMHMSDADIKQVLSSVETAVPKLQALEEELTAASAEIDTMNQTYEDMVRRGDPNAASYGRELQKKIDDYNKRVNEEYKPTWEAYDRDRNAYEQVMSAIDAAVESGLTGGEKALLEALERYTEAKTLRSDDVSVAGKAGAGAEQSAEFMLDFILTGGLEKAGTKVATKLATKRALKRYGPEFMKDLAMKGRSITPGLGLRLATDAVTSAGRTMAMFPRTLQAYGDNATEYSGKDAAGRIEFDRTQANALGNSLLSQYIEYWSEGFGEYFGDAERALFRSVTKKAPKEMIGKTLRGYSGSIGQFLDKGKFNGMFNEMLEEVVGSSLNALTGWMSGDRVGDADAMKEFFAGENLATLALSFLPMSAIGAATNMASYHKMKQRYDQGVAALNPFIESGAVSRQELDQLAKDIPEMTPEQVKDKIVDIADRAREANGGKLPSDFAKNLMGYLEGEFAMSLRYDEWEDSQEKMSVVNAYSSNYANPDARDAWDLDNAEATARKEALESGFTEEDLADKDSYQLAEEAFEMKGTQPERSKVLMNYATAKAGVEGLQNGYNEQTRMVSEAYGENVRGNLAVNGNVTTASIMLNGRPTTVYVTQGDATVTPSGTISTPTGDGAVKYRLNENSPEQTAKAYMFSNAQQFNADDYIGARQQQYQQMRGQVYETAQNTVSPNGQAKAIYDRLGYTVIVDDHKGVYEPFFVERMTNDGSTVVISGERKALQGVARRMGLEAPGGKYLEAPVTSLYPLLAKEADGSLSTDLPMNPAKQENEAQAQETAPAAEQQQAEGVGDLRDRTVPIVMGGQAQDAHVIDTSGGNVVFELLDENGDVTRTARLPEADFARAMQEAQTPAQQEEEVVEETPAEVVGEAPAQEEETGLPESTEPFIPIDEKTGEKIYDAPGVEVADAIADLYATEGLTEEDVDQYIADRAAQSEAARNPERGDMSPAAWGQAKKEAARVADFWNAMAQAAAARKQQEEAPAAVEETPAPAEEATIAREPEPAPVQEREAAEESKPEDKAKRKLARRLKNWQKRTGVKVRVINSYDEVTDQQAKEALDEGRVLTGWYNDGTGMVEIYMPNIDAEAQLDATFIHEVVSHKGLRALLGEEGYNELCDRVWDEVMTDGDKAYYMRYNRHLSADGVALRRASADEYIARLSENLDFYDNRSIFQKLVDWIKRILGQELSLAEIETDAAERAGADTASMSDDALRIILSDSMKRYVQTTRRGQQDAAAKNEISSNVGGAMQTDGNSNGQTRFSMKSIVTGGGLDVVENDGKGNVAFVTTDGRTFDAEHPITARDLMGLENTVMYHMMKDAREITRLDPQKEMRIWQAYADQLNAFLQKGVAKDGLEGVDRIKALWQWEVENSVYRSVAPNSDEQYKYSLDITRVCKKNEAVIKAISAMQRQLGYGITPGQVMDIYMAGIEEGYQVPCPVCYVFSRYIDNGVVATIAINGQTRWGSDLVDPSTLSEEEKQEKIRMWKKRLDEQEEYNKKYEKQIAQAKKDCKSIIAEIDRISELVTSGKLKGKERSAALKRAQLLENRYRSAFDVVSQSALTQWIKQFAIRQTKNGYAPTKDGKKYELWNDTFQGFPPEYALDLRLTAETIQKYPAIQRLRKARGAAGGKEIHFASNNDVGDIPMMLGADNSVNFYQKAVNARTPKERDYFLGKATERFKSAHKYAQQQSLRGGQRMWSWSDNIERLAPDVFVNLLQLQMLGGALQSYSKQLEGVNLVANMEGYVNGSLMGYGKGWTELKPEDIKVVDGKEVLAHDIKDTVIEKISGRDVPRERYLAKEGAPVIEIDGKKVTLLFDDVVGIDAYGRDVDGRHLKGLFDLNGELDKAGNILVGMNDTHIIAAMADDRVFFIIPWHASGNSIHLVQQMLHDLGVETLVKDFTDYTNVQEEKDMAKGKKKKSDEEADFVEEDADVSKEVEIEEAAPIRQEIIDFWESHKDESDRAERGLPPIPSGKDGKLSDEQKRYRRLRDAIFDGTVEELPEEDQNEIRSDLFLSQVLRKVDETVDDKEMTNGDKKFIYPYEYWNEASTYETADENGARYLEYCRRLGYKPKFVGKLDSKAKKDFGNFADHKGFWKLLIDRRMYDVKGRFQDLDPVTTDNYDPRTVDPEWTAQNFPLTTVADDPGAERIAERAIEKEGRTFKGGVPEANYAGDIRSAVRKYDMVSKMVDIKPAKGKTMFRDVEEDREAYADPQVAEGGVTMFRERTAEAPKKQQEVYKLMRLGDDGKLYPLFIDSASPIEIGKWYDADSPALKDVENLPSDTYTGKRDIKDKDGNKIGEEEYKYASYIVDNETGEAMSIADFKAAHKGDKAFSKMMKMQGTPNKDAINWATENGMRWIRIEEKKAAQKRYGGSNRAYYNYGINGSNAVGTYAMRPGWHAGSLPSMRQIGKGKGRNLRDDRFVWVKGYVPADIDYNEEAQGNPDKDIPTHIPENGYYLKATNANAEASQADRIGWYVAGSFFPDRIMSDSEAKAVIDQWNTEHPDEQVEYDWPRESGKVFNAETMQLEDPDKGPDGGGTRFREDTLTDEEKDIKAKTEADGTFMKAPNGNPTNLSEKQWLQVRTKEFKAWFGDWENDPENASKVVDENGEPRVVYHGSHWNPMAEAPGKAVFDDNRAGQNFDSVDIDWNFFFTASEASARGYGEAIPVFLNMRNPEVHTIKERVSYEMDEETGHDIVVTAHDAGSEYDEVTKVENPDGAIYTIRAVDVRESERKFGEAIQAWEGEHKAELEDEYNRLSVQRDAIFDQMEEVHRDLYDRIGMAQTFYGMSYDQMKERANYVLDNMIDTIVHASDKYAEDAAKLDDLNKQFNEVDQKMFRIFQRVGIEGRPEYEDYQGDEVEYDYRQTDVFALDKPNQIKSATANNGQFDTNNPDIRFRDADEREREYERQKEASDERFRNGMVNKVIELTAKDIKEGRELNGSNTGMRINLGRPGGTLLYSGLLDQPIVSTEYDLMEEAALGYGDKHSYHPFDVNDLQDLATLINHPVAVFRDKKNPYNRAILLDKKGYLLDRKETGKHDYVVIVGSSPVLDERGNYVMNSEGRRTYENRIITIFPAQGKWREFYTHLKNLAKGDESVGKNVMWVDNKKISPWVKGHATSVRAYDAITQEDVANIRKSFDNKQDLLRIDAKNSRPNTRFREVTPEQDAEYMEAVNSGNMEKAQAMVNAAAKAAMPNTKVVDENGNPKKVYHGTHTYGFTEFAQPGEFLQGLIWATDQKRYAEVYADYAMGEDEAGVYDLFVNIQNPLDLGYIEDVVRSETWDNLAEKFGMSPEELFNELNPYPGMTFEDAKKRSYYIYDYTREDRFVNLLKEHGYDGVIAEEEGINRTPVVGAVDPNQVKSAEPVVRDDNGNVIPLSQRFNEDSNDIRFRERTPDDARTAQAGYEQEIQRKTTQFILEWQNEDIPVRIAINQVMNEVGMDRLPEDADYLTRHNLVSSRADAQMHKYKLFYFEPMMKAIGRIEDVFAGGKPSVFDRLNGRTQKRVDAYNQIVDYCYAVSGLERNAWKRAEAQELKRKAVERLAEAWAKETEAINADSRLTDEEKSSAIDAADRRYRKERDEIDAKYADRDYSGITDLMGRPKEEWQEAEADAQKMIDAFKTELRDLLWTDGKTGAEADAEADAMLNEMWDRIRDCTDFNLEHAYQYGLLSRAEYERLHGTDSQPRMWNYYLPLRGFAERTAEDEYSYSMFTSDMAGGDVAKQAKGRVTRADDPFAVMRHISEQEIVQGLQNWAKQALFNFVMYAGDNSLLTQVEPWYVKEQGTDNWIAAEPKSKAAGDEKDETLEEFEERMQEAQKHHEARRGRNGLKIGHLMGNKMHRNQHMIRLKINGAEKMIWVNGNPIMAQAVNGIPGWSNRVLSGLRYINRGLSQFYTTYSLKFLTKNKLRDTQFSRIAALVDEDQPYLTQLEKNWWANNGYVAFGYPMMKLVSMWESGELEKKENKTPREQMFIDFMYDGGATGYTMINSMDKIKRDLEKMVKNAGRGERNIPIIDWYAKGVGALNEACELLTRFTFYQTSRDMGRSRERAAYDAKESSVNFNRRGLRSGVGVNGFMAALAGSLYLFINPAIQGLDKFVRLHRSHPWKMGLVDATYFMMGFVNSMLNAMIAGFSDGDDDDEKKMGPDWYWNIPEWVRRSNMIIGSPFKKLGKWGYLVLALPIEYKGFYAMGELVSSLIQGKYAARDSRTIANEVVGVVAELLPINPVEGYTPGDNPAMSIVRNMMPDVAAPIMDVATNRSFAGIPLWKENIYDENEPLSQSAFASTPEILNKAVIKLSEATATKPWHVDIPSGAIRGILKGYGGGAYTFVEDVGKVVFADPAHPRRYENYPFISGFTGYLEDDRRDSFSSDALQRYKELEGDVIKRLRSAAPGEKITESMVYNHPEDLPEKARVARLLIMDKWNLGKMYYDGMKQKSGEKEARVNKRGDIYYVDVKDDINSLRKAWNDAKKKYIEIAEDKSSTEAEKEAAEKEVQKAWLKFTQSEDALVDALMQEEYYHVKQKIENGIPYEPKETLSEKAYNLTNRK